MKTFKDDLTPSQALPRDWLMGELRVLAFSLRENPAFLDADFKERLIKTVEGFSRQIPNIDNAPDRTGAAVGFIATGMHIYKGDRVGACHSALSALTKSPDNAALWYALGEGLMMYQEDFLAKKVIDHAANLNPGYVNRAYERDELTARLGGLNTAYFRQLGAGGEELASERVDAIAFLETGMIDAIKDSGISGTKALERGLSFFGRHLDLGTRLDTDSRQRFSRALHQGFVEMSSEAVEIPVVWLVEAISLNPNHARPFQLAAHILSDAKKFVEAGLFLSHAQLVNPNDESVARDISAIEKFLVLGSKGKPNLESREELAKLVRSDLRDINRNI